MTYHSKVLQELSLLEDNWDEMGALKPHPLVLEKAEYLLGVLDILGEEPYHVAPGPNGEILIEIRKEEKDIEIIFYPDKDRYVVFPKTTNIFQGNFNFDKLEYILNS